MGFQSEQVTARCNHMDKSHKHMLSKEVRLKECIPTYIKFSNRQN